MPNVLVLDLRNVNCLRVFDIWDMVLLVSHRYPWILSTRYFIFLTERRFSFIDILPHISQVHADLCFSIWSSRLPFLMHHIRENCKWPSKKLRSFRKQKTPWAIQNMSFIIIKRDITDFLLNICYYNLGVEARKVRKARKVWRKWPISYKFYLTSNCWNRNANKVETFWVRTIMFLSC